MADLLPRQPLYQPQWRSYPYILAVNLGRNSALLKDLLKMAASHNDAFQLSQDTTFQNRVQAALLSACVSIANEGWAVAFHRERSQFAQQVLAGVGSAQASYVLLFSNSVATDPTVLSDATQAGTVPITTGNRAAQAALVTDAHLDTAIASQFNTFIREPQN